MDKVAIFKEITERNALRKQAQLPLLDVRTEFDHACAVALEAEWRAFCAAMQADIDRIRAEVIAERGGRPVQNWIDNIGVTHKVDQRFEAYAAIHYGVQRPGEARRNPFPIPQLLPRRSP